MDTELGKFLKYLIRHHGNEFENACRRYVETHPNTYREACENIRYASSIELYDPDYQRADVYIIKGVRLLVDVHINAIAEVQDGSSKGFDSELIYHWITLRCEYNVAKDELTIKNTFEYEGRAKVDGIELDDDTLTPKIYRDEGFERVAEYILQKYYPEAIDNITPVDINVIAKKLKLDIKETKISKDGSVFGRICFVGTEIELPDSDGEWKTTEIEKNTLLVDNEVGFLKSFGSPRITKAHESIHYIIHKAAFFFARKKKKKLSGIQCKVVGQGSDDTDLIPLQQFEIQANKLAPMILMPKKQFIKKANEVMRDINTIYGGNLLDETEEVIRALADYYGTTMYSVRKRLAEVGYEYMLGSLNWVDGKYATPYSFDRGSLKYNETFTISKLDYLSMFEKLESYNELSNFGIAMLSGSLIFVDNHVVINSPKYVKKDIFGRNQLTNEARNHLNKCAIKFKVNTVNAIDEEDRIGTMCYLCRDSSYTYALDVIVTDENNKIVTGESFKDYLEIAIKDNKELVVVQTSTPEEALKILMEYFKVTTNDLAKKSKLATRTISRYRGEDKSHPTLNPEKETVIRICIGLELPPIVANYYLKACGITLKMANKQDAAYHAFLNGYGEYDIERCNDLLDSAELDKFYEENE